jgi:hypothetical protein
MYVSAGNRIADAEETKRAGAVADRSLRPAGEECGVVYFTKIERSRSQRLVQIRQRERSVLDHHLVDQAVETPRPVVGADGCAQPVALALDRQ